MKVLFAFLFFSLISYAQSTASSLLWEIKGPQQTKSSYIFGTMHLMDDSHFYFPKKLEKIILNVETVCLEINDIQHTQLNPELLFLNEGGFLAQLSELAMDSICNWANEKLLMNREQFTANFSKAKPFLIYQLILQSELPANLQSQELAIEKLLLSKKKKQTIGLETVESQLALFDDLPFESQVNLIMTEIAAESDVLINFTNLQENYLEQNVEKIHDLLLKENTDPIFNVRFIDERNVTWVKKMIPMISSQSILFAVGAGHLGGENGVLNLLRKEGYTLTPISL